MKVEIRCPKCGREHLVEPESLSDAGARMTCKGCGRSLPLAGLAPMRPPPRPEAAAGLNPSGPGGGEGIVCPRCGLHFSPKVSRPAAESKRRCRVLVVEDMPFFQESVREALAEQYDLVFASSVAEARRALEGEALDLLLLDLTLENGEDGRALLRALPSKPCPILIYTSADEAEMYGDGWQSLRALGADDVVVKGMHAGEALARKVSEILGRGPAPGPAS